MDKKLLMTFQLLTDYLSVHIVRRDNLIIKLLYFHIKEFVLKSYNNKIEIE
jgi:hypothetical protein